MVKQGLVIQVLCGLALQENRHVFKKQFGCELVLKLRQQIFNPELLQVLATASISPKILEIELLGFVGYR